MGIGKYIVALALFGYLLSAIKVVGDLAAVFWLVYLPPFVLAAGMAIIAFEVMLRREKRWWITLPVVFFGVGIFAHIVSSRYHEENAAEFLSSIARAEKIDWPETIKVLGIERNSRSTQFQPAELLADYNVPVIVERQTDTGRIYRYEVVAHRRREDGATNFTDRDGVTYFPVGGQGRASIALRKLEEWPGNIDTVITEKAMESDRLIGWKATYELRHADGSAMLVAGNARVLGWFPAVVIRRDPHSFGRITKIEHLFSRRRFYDPEYSWGHERVGAILSLPAQNLSRFEDEESQGDGSVAAR